MPVLLQELETFTEQKNRNLAWFSWDLPSSGKQTKQTTKSTESRGNLILGKINK